MSQELDVATNTIRDLRKQLEEVRVQLENDVKIATEKAEKANAREIKAVERAVAAAKGKQEAQKLISEAEKEKKNALDKIFELEKANEESLKKMTVAVQEKIKAEQELCTEKEKSKAVKQQLDASEKERLQSLQQLTNANEEKKEVVQKLSLIENEIQQSNISETANEEERNSLLEKLNKVEKAKAEAMDETFRTKKEMQDLLQKLSVTEDARTKLIAKYTTAKKDKQELIQKLIATEESKGDLIEKFANAEEDKIKLLEKLTQLEETKTNAVKLLEDSEATNMDLLQKATAIEGTNRELSEKLKKSEKIKEELLQKLNSAEKAEKDAIQKLISEEAQRHLSAQKFTTAEEDNKSLIKELEENEKAKKYLLEQLDNFENEKETMSKIVADMKSGQEHALTQLKNAESELEEVLQELMTVRDERDEALKKALLLEKKINSTQATNEKEEQYPPSKESPKERYGSKTVGHMSKLKLKLMERAGVDPITYSVGFLNGGYHRPSPSSENNQKLNVQQSQINNLVDFLNEQTNDAFDKAQIGSMLAEELDVHHQLQKKRDDLKDTNPGNNESSKKLELEHLDTEIDSRQKQVRLLSKVLGIGEQISSKNGGKDSSLESRNRRNFLTNEKFKSLNIGFTQLNAAQTASKILLGMLIDERNRNGSFKVFTEEDLKLRLAEIENIEKKKETLRTKRTSKLDLTIKPTALNKLYTKLSSSEKIAEKPKIRLGASDVFRRLTNPENFTGIQKQKRELKSMTEKDPYQTKLRNHDKPPPSPRPKKSGGPSVFERLQSPLNYTGIQKTVFLSQDSDDEMHDNSMHSTKSVPVRFETALSSPNDYILDSPMSSSSNLRKTSKVLKSSSRDWVANYTTKNVFERLQQNSTSAFDRSKYSKSRNSI